VPNQYTDSQPYQDEETLRELYHDQDLTAEEIAERFDVSQPTISRWLNLNDIETRSPKESREVRGTTAGPKAEGPHTSEEWLRECYFDKKMSVEEMANEAGLESSVSIIEWMDKFGIDRRPNYVTRVLRNPGAGFIHADDDGYERIRHSVDDSVKQFAIHRLLAIAEYGYEEVNDKRVHHKNGVPWDNRYENITLVEDQAEHAKHHEGEWGNVRDNTVRDEGTGRYIG
jgi:DNA-binding transcriptional ArsR family regulator